MVDPALGELRKLVLKARSESVKLGAIETVLDRTGYKLPERIEADNAVTIKVEYDQAPAPAQVIEQHYEQLQNGASNGTSKDRHVG